MLTTTIPSNRQAVVKLPVTAGHGERHTAHVAEPHPTLAVRKPAPDATQAAVKVDYTIVQFSY